MSNIRQRFQNQIATTFVEKVNKLKQDKKIIIQPSKSLFIDKVPSITNNDFMDIEDMSIDNACQRETFSQKREKSFTNIAKAFDPRRFGRVTIGNLPNDDNNYVVDGLGRTSVASSLGFQSLPVEIIKFDNRGEMLSYFLSQHDDQTKISNWERWDVVRQTPASDKKLYLTHWNKAQDIERIMVEHKFTYDDGKTHWNSFWSKADTVSVEYAYTAIAKCITRTYSAQKGVSAGSRKSLVLSKALDLYKKHFISEQHLSVVGNALIVMCVYLSHKKWNPSDKEPTKVLDLKQGLNSDKKEITVLEQRVKTLDTFLSKLCKMNGEEFFSIVCEGKNQHGKAIETDVPKTLLNRIRKSNNTNKSSMVSHINQTLRRHRI
jgi:hypothetical protein